ncbi:hypothetical protein KQI65_10620 [bacterium]|nr:hypothetical protein [bacterium]
MKKILYCILIGMLALPCHLEAGRLYARVSGKASPIYNLEQTEVHTAVRIDDRLATTHVDERFFNDTGLELEGFYVFQLPEGARVDGLWMWVDGERYVFKVRRKEEAEALYDSLKNQGVGDPAILSSLGSNRFQLRIFPLRPGEVRRIELEYFQLLPVDESGTIRFFYPMNQSGYQHAPVAVLDMHLELTMQAPILDLQSNFDGNPTIQTRTEYSDRHIAVDFGSENILIEQDYVLTWKLDGWDKKLFVLTHGSAADPDSSFFLAWFPDQLSEEDIIPVDYILALDASGSMCGLREQLLRELPAHIIPRMRPMDRLHMMLFNQEVAHWPSDTTLQFQDSILLASVNQFLGHLYRPTGITDYEQVLSSIATLALRDEAITRCVFVSDGLVNRGAKGSLDLLAALAVENHSVMFSPVCIYTDHIEAMYDLAHLSSGDICTLDQGMEVDDMFKRFTYAWSTEAVVDLSLQFPQGTMDITPRHRDVAVLQASAATGRFTHTLSGDAILRYRLQGDDQPVEKRRSMILWRDTTSQEQIARYWAAARIEELCDTLRYMEDSTSIREEVIRLSEKYNVISPFTAFIVYKDVDPGGMTALHSVAELHSLRLDQNYPNPFNPTTTISFYLPGAGQLRLCVYDASGRLVDVLAEGFFPAGDHRVTWDGRDSHGRILPSGSYYCVLSSGGARRVITMSFIK